MLLATQCPFCETTFRVAQDQLTLRDGLVRCSHCKKIFNGIQHLVTPATPPWMASADLSATVANIAAATHDAPWNSPRTTAVPTSNAPHSAESAIQRHAEVAQDASANETPKTEQDAKDVPTFVQHAKRRERLRRIMDVATVLGVAILSITLLLQALYLGRNHIASWLPATHPSLSSLCAALGCSIGLPTNIAVLSLESSELQLLPPHQNIYTLNVLLRNRSHATQAWPSMELTLNDSDEQVIIRRVFTPRELLSSRQQINAGFAGVSEQQIKLTLELTQPAAAYRIVLFFP